MSCSACDLAFEPSTNLPPAFDCPCLGAKAAAVSSQSAFLLAAVTSRHQSESSNAALGVLPDVLAPSLPDEGPPA